MKLIVGLGNPGKQYQYTRHNIGFLVLDSLAHKWGVNIDRVKFKSLVGEGIFNEEKVLLLKPQTFMNLSGEAVLEIVQFYKIDTKDILVVYDDMDLHTGRLRLRLKGGSGGHRGMESIIYLLHTEDFPRLRIGIGKPGQEKGTIGHVLGKFTAEEEKIFTQVIEKSVESIEKVLTDGTEKAMNQVNAWSLEE